MSDRWSQKGGAWTRLSGARAIRERQKDAAKRALRSLGLEVRRTKGPPWASDPWETQATLLADVRRPVIFDVGANVGQTMERYKAAFPNAVVHSFEPFPGSFARLGETAAALSDAHAHELALADEPGSRTFHTNPDFHTRNSLLTRPEGGRRYYSAGADLPDEITVTVDTVDAFCAREGIERIDVLKLDVQGAEGMVLRGAEGMLRSDAIGVVFTEAMFVPHYEGGPLFHQLVAQLDPFGFSVFNIFDPIVANNGQLRYANALLVGAGLRARVLDRFPEEG